MASGNFNPFSSAQRGCHSPCLTRVNSACEVWSVNAAVKAFRAGSALRQGDEAPSQARLWMPFRSHGFPSQETQQPTVSTHSR
jgi:hypothetical protein